jgi:hypothetical protein
MFAPYSNSEKKESSHAKLSLRGLRSRVPRADLRQTALYTEWLEASQRPETLAEVSPPWSILRSMPAQACAHACGQRADCFRAWPFTSAIVPSFFLRTHELNGMAEDCGGEQSEQRWEPTRDTHDWCSSSACIAVGCWGVHAERRMQSARK